MGAVRKTHPQNTKDSKSCISIVDPRGNVRKADQKGQSAQHLDRIALRRTSMDEIKSVFVHAESSSFGDY